LPAARDFKRAYDGDRGPNTGGMGSFAPARGVDVEAVRDQVHLPVIREPARRGSPFVGVLYAGLMLTESGPKILEFNARFGDPEAEVILPRVNSDLAALLVSATRGELEGITPIEVSPEACVGIVLCSGGYPGPFEKGKPITGLPEAERMPSVQIFHAGPAIEGGRRVSAGGRVLVVTALGPSLSEAAARAYEACDTIEFEGKHLRRDIPPKSARLTKP